MPRYAITDIHGCPKTLAALLDRIGFRRGDDLFLLGDYIDRGPDSLGVLQLIWELEEAGHSVFCLRGNHESMLLDALRSGRSPWDYAPAPEDRERVRRWMTALPNYLEVEGYLLVHAGLNFAIPDPLLDIEAMLWIRGWYRQIDARWLDGRVIVHGHTPQTVERVRRDLIEVDQGHRICLDSGCAFELYGMGHLTALNLDNRELTFCRRVD